MLSRKHTLTASPSVWLLEGKNQFNALTHPVIISIDTHIPFSWYYSWTGSLYFSSLISSSSSRNAWSDVLVNTVEKYNLDGLNLDWEYPNDPNGVACNVK
jgi:hypothetical protein